MLGTTRFKTSGHNLKHAGHNNPKHLDIIRLITSGQNFPCEGSASMQRLASKTTKVHEEYKHGCLKNFSTLILRVGVVVVVTGF